MTGKDAQNPHVHVLLRDRFFAAERESHVAQGLKVVKGQKVPHWPSRLPTKDQPGSTAIFRAEWQSVVNSIAERDGMWIRVSSGVNVEVIRDRRVMLDVAHAFAVRHRQPVDSVRHNGRVPISLRGQYAGPAAGCSLPTRCFMHSPASQRGRQRVSLSGFDRTRKAPRRHT